MKPSSVFKSHLSVSLRNTVILLIVFVLTLNSAEYFLQKSTFTDNPDSYKDIIKVYMMGFEKSSNNQLRSSYTIENLFEYETAVVEKSLQKSDDVYPLIEDISTGNTYDENTVNIVVLGDSLVWGAACLDRNELFWQILEKDLRKKGYNCRVFGVGILGANSVEELNWLTNTSLVKDLNPDLVLFGYIFNDPDPYSFLDTKKAFVFFENKETHVSSLLKKIFPNISERLKNNIIAKTMYSAEKSNEAFLFSGGIVRSTIYILKGEMYEQFENRFVCPVDDFAINSNFPISVTTLPLPIAYQIQKALYKPMHTLFSEYTNVSFYDCLDEMKHNFFSHKHHDNYFVSSEDSHPGSATNRFYADYIINFLEKDYADVLGKSSGKDLNNYDIFINDCMPGKLNLTEESRTDSCVTYTLDYPSYNKQYSFLHYDFDNYFLNYPLGQDYIKLSFSQPQDLDSITITGDGIENIDLYYTKLNEKLNYDDHKILPFGTKSSDGKTWTDDTSDKVMSLCIHADCKNDDGSKLQITISKKG